MKTTTIHRGTLLFRAADTIEEHPKPRKCNDTGKTGVYFSFNSPYLSETMCLEYKKDLSIAVYKVIRDITDVSIGKYAFTRGYTGRYANEWDDVPPEDNWSHYDEGIRSIWTNIRDPGELCAELFLTGDDLAKIEFIDSYFMPLEEAEWKWIQR